MSAVRIRARNAAYTSAPARTASANDAAPMGASMSSWNSRGFWACAPPSITLKCGTGSLGSQPSGASHWYSPTASRVPVDAPEGTPAVTVGR